MAGLFTRPKVVTPPPLPPAPAPPAISEVGPEAGEAEMRRVRRRRGFARTIVTGALEPPTRKKTVLG